MAFANTDPSVHVIAVIQKTSGASPDLVATRYAGIRLARLVGYPSPDLVTLVTVGLSNDVHTFHRGRQVGFELTLTAPPAIARDLADRLSAAAHESIRLRKSGERRPPVEYNGLYAPGYPPHLLFCSELSLTPDLEGRQRAGERYVEFLPAIPISDAELRRYDRSVRALIDELRAGGDLADYTRRT